MSAPNSRKRAAPGASASISFPQQPYQTNPAVNDQLQRWNGMSGNDMGNFIDTASGIDSLTNAYDLSQFNNAQPSNTLARRPMSNALMPANLGANQEWGLVGDERGLIPHNGAEASPETDSIEVLEEKAQKAKRDAQGKRKQIPPFVQKLSSFLEEGKNEDLIRWSEKGDSFIVIDEDEFAKTLIPELFKHNNYASFVRQLNMYGFHKKVGLSDNSMRASERKNKSPSEYSNPYFRRGHPNLLWLISKPKSGSKTKKGTKGGDGEFDSDDDGSPEMQNAPAVGSGNAQQPKSLPAPADQQPMQKKDMQLIKQEIKQLREGQQRVMATLQQINQNNNDLYNQAALFQNQHDRHQNSINAILSFLANVFRKTLEDQGGSAPNVGDIFSSLMTPQGNQAGGQSSGSVVDLGDFFQNQTNSGNMAGTPSKRPMKLLLPPPVNPEVGRAATASRSPSTTSTSYRSSNRNPSMATVTELNDLPADTPPDLRQELESNPQESMMKIINDHNATNPTGSLPDAADLVANAPNTLNHDQRSRLVNLMANQSSVPNMNGTSANAAGQAAHGEPSNASRTTQSPPANPPSLSPIMRSPAVQPPSINQINANQQELEELQRIQNEQSARINELNEMLGPLSPSGNVPGIDAESAQEYFDPPDTAFDQYFNTEQFLPGVDDQAFGDGDDFNFNLDSAGNVAPPGANGGGAGFGGGLQVPDMGGAAAPQGNGPAVNTGGHNTPSPAGTEEIPRGDLGFLEDRTGKRRRIS